MTEIDAPTIDVIIPVFNGEKYIINTLVSISNQTMLPQQIIVVDDGSYDSTPDLVNSYESPVPIKYIKKKNGGLSSARNAGIMHSTADLVAFLDADDLWENTKLEKQLQLFIHSDIRNLGIVYCDYYLIDELGGKVQTPRFHVKASLRGNIFSELLHGNRVAGSGSAVLVRRDCFGEVGGFDESLAASEDWDMWLRLAAKYNFDYINEELVAIRRHGSNMSKDAWRMIASDARVLHKYLGQVPLRVIDELSIRIITEVLKGLPSTKALGEIHRHLSPEIHEMIFGSPLRNLLNFVRTVKRATTKYLKL